MIINELERYQDALAESNLVDETSDASFPASDPPSWTPTQGSGAPAGHLGHAVETEAPLKDGRVSLADAE
jgi:hypothetical protein